MVGRKRGAETQLNAAEASSETDRKRAKLTAQGSSEENPIELFFADREVSAFEKLTKLFDAGQLNELQLSDLLERYLMLYPQFFQFLDTDKSDGENEKFRREVIALFSSNCAPMVDLIFKITIYSSSPTIRRITDILLRLFIQGVKPLLVIEFVMNAAISNKTQCRFLPDAEQCATLLDYVLAELTTNQSYSVFFPNPSAAGHPTNIPRKKNAPPKGQAGKFGKSFPNNTIVKEENPSSSRSNIPDEVPDVVERFLRILAVVLGDDNTPSSARKAGCVLKSIQSKVAAIRARSRGRLTDALSIVMQSTQRRFPGFSWNEHSSIAHVLPSVFHEKTKAPGHYGVAPSLFIGSRRQLLRPIELLTIADFDDILHRTLTDLHQLVLTNSESGGFLTTAGQSKLRSPTGELITSIMNNLISEMKSKPYVMARQVPLLSNLISSVLQREFRQFRDAPFLMRYLEFSLEVLLGTAPDVYEDISAIRFLLQSFLRFFENLTKPNRNWFDILEKSALALLDFYNRRPTEAAQFIALYASNVRFLAKRCTERRPMEMGRLMDALHASKRKQRSDGF